jgi:hypothetical protein
MSHNNPIPSTLISDSTAAGRSVLTAADAAAQRTALGLADVSTPVAVAQTAVVGDTITLDLTSGALGVTLTNGTGTAATTATTATLSMSAVATSAYSGSSYTSPRVLYSIADGSTTPALSPHRYEFTARLSAVSGRTAGTYVIVAVENGATRKVLYFNSTTCVVYTGTSIAVLATYNSCGVLYDGSDWIRVRVDGSRATFYIGRGTTSAMDEGDWKLVVETTVSEVSVPGGTGLPTIALVLVQSPAAGGSGSSITYSNVTVRRL